MGVLAVDGERVRDAAWIARCVGRRESAPLRPEDVQALAADLEHRHFDSGQAAYHAGELPAGVWIVRSGMLELSVGSGPRRVIVHMLRPGDVDGDLQLLMGMPMRYNARASGPAQCLFLPGARFELLLATHPALSRRWLTSVASRLATSQQRLVDMLGRPLPAQLARLLLDDAVEGETALAQSTLAAMLGVRRPSVNRILQDWQRDGVVATGYGRVRLLNLPRLERLAR